MKALGKIGNIEVTYSQEKTSERDGHKFWYERHTVFFESGDDTHMVTVGTHTQGQGGGIEVLKRRGIEIGARGEMTMRYGFRDWNGKKFPECELVRFDSMEAKPAVQGEAKPGEVPAYASPSATKPDEVAEQFAMSAAEENLNPDDLAF